MRRRGRPGTIGAQAPSRTQIFSGSSGLAPRPAIRVDAAPDPADAAGPGGLPPGSFSEVLRMAPLVTASVIRSGVGEGPWRRRVRRSQTRAPSTGIFGMGNLISHRRNRAMTADEFEICFDKGVTDGLPPSARGVQSPRGPDLDPLRGTPHRRQRTDPHTRRSHQRLSAVFGPVFRANATIGPALRLLMINVGGARPGEISMSTFGHPGRRCTYCIGENEEASPWHEPPVRLA